MVAAWNDNSGYDALARAHLANGRAVEVQEQIAEARMTLAGQH
jgi:hypothetical protein